MSGKKGCSNTHSRRNWKPCGYFMRKGKRGQRSRRVLKIRDRWRVKKWLHQYRQEGVAAFDKKPKGLVGRPQEGEPRGLYRPLGDGECAAKKTSSRVAQGYAREAQYRVIERYRPTYTVKAMCTLFGVSRAAYYAWRRRSARPDPDERPSWVSAGLPALASTRTAIGELPLWLHFRKAGASTRRPFYA